MVCHVFRTHTLSLLLEVPGHQLPYFKFRELCEKRFKISPSLSDLHKIRDVCVVTEEATGRTICLNPDIRNSPSPLLANVSVSTWDTNDVREKKSYSQAFQL